jgi:hypothetical protein
VSDVITSDARGAKVRGKGNAMTEVQIRVTFFEGAQKLKNMDDC